MAFRVTCYVSGAVCIPYNIHIYMCVLCACVCLPLSLSLGLHCSQGDARAYILQCDMLLCVSTGLQEYVEAVSFYYYLKDGMLVTLSQVEKDLKFSRSSAAEIAQQKPSTDLKNPATVLASTSESCTSSVPASSSDKSPSGGSVLVDSAGEVSSSSDGVMKVDSKEPADGHADGTISVTVPPMEFMLGIADLTGELMRTAIMSVSAGNLDYPVQICDFMRIIHDSFMSYGNTARELTRKMATLRQSLQKVENACYTLKVRGSEIPKHMLADIFTATSSEGPFAEDMEGSGFD